MLNSKKSVYVIDLVLGLFLFILMFFYKNPTFVNIINVIFWIVLFCFITFYWGIPKNKNYFKKVVFRYTLICCLSYLIIIYLLGIFLGFSRLIFSHQIIRMLKNILGPLILVITQEIIRYVICKKSFKSKKPLIIFTILIVILNIFLSFITADVNNLEGLFVFICIDAFPIMAREALYTYISYNVSCKPNFIIRFGVDLLIYLLPFYPNLGNYLEAVFRLALPFFIYLTVSKILKYHEKKNLNFHRFAFNTTAIPLLIFTGIVVLLISGLFKYQLVAIASDSMNPVYYRGDAVIIDKVNANLINEGDILAFYRNNNVITHRVVKKNVFDDHIEFVTKGDNNNSNDLGVVKSSDVMGKVRLVAKFIGYPTLWFNDTIKK